MEEAVNDLVTIFVSKAQRTSKLPHAEASDSSDEEEHGNLF